MSDQQWAAGPPPGDDTVGAMIWRGAPNSAADLSTGRAELRELLAGPVPAGGADTEDAERLLLLFEELASNGLRHGLPPVWVTLTENSAGWALEVSDADALHPPARAVGRDAALGGLGLLVVARLAAGHGWYTRDGRKHVWACLDRSQSAVGRGSPSVA